MQHTVGHKGGGGLIALFIIFIIPVFVWLKNPSSLHTRLYTPV